MRCPNCNRLNDGWSMKKKATKEYKVYYCRQCDEEFQVPKRQEK